MTALAERLEAVGYRGLFLSMGDEGRRQLGAGANQADLIDLVADATAAPEPRFLAAELLATEHGTWDGIDPQVVAEVYVDGLRANATSDANPWGLPGQLGPLSERLVALGEPARQPLVRALDDNTAMTFSGSREATIGNSYGWRVRDQAHAILLGLDGVAWSPAVDRADRDREIGGST